MTLSAAMTNVLEEAAVQPRRSVSKPLPITSPFSLWNRCGTKWRRLPDLSILFWNSPGCARGGSVSAPGAPSTCS